MLKFEFILIACVLINFSKCMSIDDSTEDETPLIDEREASDFFDSSSDGAYKRFLYTGKEQRREAKENFEEKCERKTLGIHRTSKPRWCPELPSWDQWMQAAKGDGVVYPPVKTGNTVVNPVAPQINPVAPQINPSLGPYMPVNVPYGRPNQYPQPNMPPFGRPNPNPYQPNPFGRPNPYPQPNVPGFRPNPNQFPQYPNQYGPNIMNQG